MCSESFVHSAERSGAGVVAGSATASPTLSLTILSSRHVSRPDDRITLVKPHSSDSAKRGEVSYPIGTAGTIIEEDCNTGGRTRRWWVFMDGSDREVSISEYKLAAISG